MSDNSLGSAQGAWNRERGTRIILPVLDLRPYQEPMKHRPLLFLMFVLVCTTGPLALPAAPTTAPSNELDALVAAVGNGALNVANAQMNYENATVTVAVAATLKASLSNQGEAATLADSAWHDAVKAQDRAKVNVSSALANLSTDNKLLERSIAKQDNASVLPPTTQK